MVILNKSDYIKKIDNILLDETKFERIGLTSTCDNTTSIESRLQKRLLELLKSRLISENTCQEIRPTGSQRLPMYRLPKTHKPNVPLRPILSMTGSAHHQLSKWLASLLQPVLDRFAAQCIPDSFTFADYIRAPTGIRPLHSTMHPWLIYICRLYSETGWAGQGWKPGYLALECQFQFRCVETQMSGFSFGLVSRLLKNRFQFRFQFCLRTASVFGFQFRFKFHPRKLLYFE